MISLHKYSGGKDSCYNMMQCIAHGHNIIALANLYPKNEGCYLYIFRIHYLNCILNYLFNNI